MTIGEMLKQAFHYARTCKSLWLFGFVVGITSGGSSSGGPGGQDGGVSIGAGGVAMGSGGWGLPFGFSPATIGTIVAAILLMVIVGAVMRLVSEGALIEGVARARQGGAMTMRNAFRAGWAHVGVVLQILAMYVIGTIGALALVAVPCVLAFRAFGAGAGIAVVIVALIVGVPMLVTLYLVQAFALRIAVLENRRASDAIGKARLFLHGRLMHGLKLIVAMFVGTMAIAIIGIVALVPLALVLRALMPILSGFTVIVIGFTLVIPAMAVLTAIAGTFRSSVWTIGYVSEVEAA
jgi:hypothetical protein